MKRKKTKTVESVGATIVLCFTLPPPQYRLPNPDPNAFTILTVGKKGR